MDLLYILGYYSTACVYFSFRWGPFVHSLGIVQWNFTRRDHPGNPGRVSRSGPVKACIGFIPVMSEWVQANTSTLVCSTCCNRALSSSVRRELT